MKKKRTGEVPTLTWLLPVPFRKEVGVKMQINFMQIVPKLV